MRIAIIADDVTSAGDGAAPFRAAGFPASLRLALPSDTPTPAGVTAVDVDSRARPAAEGTRRTVRAAAGLADAEVLFKTVDSTLRGHLAAEVEAVLSASGRGTAVVAPAFPAEGRTTSNGVQYVAGRPVDQTWFARDPGHPVRSADLTRLFPGAASVAPNPGPASCTLGAQLAGLIGTVRHIVADARSDQDLDDLVAAVPRIERVVWVGSPGLAAALARRLAPRARPVSAAMGAASGSRVLLVVGSLHPASRRQLARLRSIRGAEAVSVMDDGAVERAERRLARRDTVILYGPQERLAQASVPVMLAEATARLSKTDAFDALVLTGGGTARTVLLALGAQTIELAGEPEPGIPLGFLDRPRRLPVIVKAGGFGDQDMLLRLRDLMTTTTPKR